MNHHKAEHGGNAGKGNAAPHTLLKSLVGLRPGSPLGTLARLPLRFVPRNHVATIRSGINKGARWIVGSSIHGCWLGTYEHELQGLISELVRPGMVVWDVGANAGFYTLAFSRLVGKPGRVYAFEPFAGNICNLLRHHGLNELDNTKVIQAALAGQSGLAGFSVGASNSQGSLSAQNTSYMVPTFAADDFIAHFPESRPQFMKIDVEGAETALLSGASELLSRSAPDILLALHGETQGRECREILVSRGYKLFYIDGSPADSVPFRSHNIEIYARRPKTT